MENNTLLDYYIQLERFLNALISYSSNDLSEIKETLAELCKYFGVSKGVTKFYKSVVHEKSGIGEEIVCYDDGTDGVEFIKKRIVTKSMTVVKCIVYRHRDALPLSEEDTQRVTMIMDMILSFISRNRLEDIVERLTFFDDNGYRNLRSFIRYLEQLNENNDFSKRTAVHFNLRHFSLINREIGRSSGDVVIRNYFDLLEKTIGDKGLICRVGGDNFVAIFKDDILEAVLDILNGVPIVYDVNNTKRIMVSASTGVFRIPDGFIYERPDDIMDRIVSSSRAAKNGGKESIVFFDDDMIVDKEKTMQVQQLFPQAMQKGEFKVFYQPKIDIDTGEIVGAEALCRWFRDGKVIPPIDFIPILEQTTDICRLDFYMLNHVCRDIRQWLDEGRKVVRISVNLSRKHMMDIDLLERIIGIVDMNRVPHQYIEIELTETTTDVEFRDLKRVVSGLQQAGICTSVDDFGMGYSSLNLIREIPWNVLKVDKSFLPVDNDNEASTRSIMFKYVVAMAKELGLECIAEGVETRNQVQVLRDNRCLFAQGFYFDRPLPIEDFEKRLATHHYNVETGEVSEA
ncbi:MAG: EAL domain-containing protein [Ruminococcus sp.]|nr:EAL domain-containing protein [Ruminococcus sp.]